MNQFTFEAKTKNTLLGFMALGVVCMLLTYFFGEPEQISVAHLHTRFWSNFLQNAIFFTGIAFISLFTLAAFTTAYAGWHVVFKRVWEAYSLFLIPGLILMLIVGAGIWGHFHHLYHWTDTEAVAADELLQGKSGFLNKFWYTFGTLIIVGIWIFFAKKLRQLSVAEDNLASGDYSLHNKARIFAAAFLPIAAYSSAVILWEWLMSIDAHWFSTMFAWYATASWFVGAFALTILTLVILKSRGYYQNVTRDHLHDLGKYMFAFSIFWTYLWFSQYMLIWFGNIGEETIYFKQRVDEYPVLFYGNLILNFALPFLILMRNKTKRQYGTMIFTSALVFFGHWWDFFYMVKPGALNTANEALAHHAGEHAQEAAHQASSFVAGFTIPGLLEIGTLFGFTAFFLFVVFNHLTKASLVPGLDPYLEESLHHEVEQDLSHG